MEFSTGSMKDALKNYSDKRVSEKAGEKLGQELQKLGGSRSAEARTNAHDNNRKTVRAEDFKQTRNHSVPKTSDIYVSGAAVERIIRSMDAERVSESAIEELMNELKYFIQENAEEAARMADHAGRNTVKAEDLELALR